jgi:hypothetical protein
MYSFSDEKWKQIARCLQEVVDILMVITFFKYFRTFEVLNFYVIRIWGISSFCVV